MATYRTRLTPLILGFALVASLTGCAAKRGVIPTGVTDPDNYLFEQGNKALAERKWYTAREYFQQLVENYPQSPHRADAKLGVGDAYLGDGTTEGKLRAEREFQEFLSFFPTHARADYAQYKLAMTHFDQMAKAERDQTETLAALEQFKAFREKFPNSPLMTDVAANERIARDRLSESIYKVGFFYHRSRWYPGAIARFRQALQEDPQFTNRDAVYFYLAEALVAVKRDAEALPLLDKLHEEFEVSEFLEKGSALREKVKATLANQVPGTTGEPTATPADVTRAAGAAPEATAPVGPAGTTSATTVQPTDRPAGSTPPEARR